MVRIPYGTSHFETLIREGYYYVDRTAYLAQIEQMGEKHIAYLRPRRFGKSLWISVLHHYYGLEHREKFDDLFGKLYIGQNPTPLAGSYLVLRFDFSGILTDTMETTYAGFLENVKASVGSFFVTYSRFFLPEDRSEVLDTDAPNTVLTRLFKRVQAKAGAHKIYVLIDEYDHFANELIAFHFADYQDVVSRNGYVRKFYEALKIGTGEGVVDRIFITGVSPITLDSFTSGFNISRNLTTSLELHQMLGFTGEEVAQLIRGVGVSEADFPQVMQDMKQWYNGYLFSEDARERLYNPDMVLYFALEYQKHKRYPKVILDTNIATDYGKLHRMFRIGEKEEQHYGIVEELVENQEISTTLTTQYSLERTFSRDDFISLLFYLGMITIKEAQIKRMVMQFPNYVIGELYHQYFADILLRRSQLTRSGIRLDDAVEGMALRNEIQPFVQIIEQVLTTLSNRDSLQFDEKHIKAIIASLLHATGIYTIKSEYESERKYVDLLLRERPPLVLNYTFALELKYLKKADAARIEAETAAGIAQLKSYLQHEELQQMHNLRAWLLVFVGTEAKAVIEVETGRA